MKRTTIMLPDDLAMILDREAKRHRLSVSEAAWRALRAHFGLDGDAPRPVPFANLGKSGYTDTAERMEEVLAEEWAADIERHRDR